MLQPGTTDYSFDSVDRRYQDRLFKAAQASYKALEPFRSMYRTLVSEYTGPNYGHGGPKNKKYINKLHQAVIGHVMLLSAKRPQVFLQTDYQELIPFSKIGQVALNNLLREIEIEKTFQEWVLNSLFCLGVIKIHRKESGLVMQEWDIEADPGLPFASVPSFDDWVHDMGAKRYSQVKFAADCYRIAYSDLERGVETGLYNPEVFDQISPNSKVETDDEERVSMFSRGQEVDLDEFEPMVDLADVWIPGENLIRTYHIQSRRTFQMNGDPLAIMEWDGTEEGPYHLLTMSDVPDNIMPSSPAGHWEALDEFINLNFRKMVRRIARLKENMVFEPGASQDANRLVQAKDGLSVGVRMLEGIKQYNQGGNVGELMNMLGSSLGAFNSVANNLDAILGLGPQAETLGQEQLIQAAGNRLANQMQYRVIDGATKVVESLWHLLWKDEFKSIAGTIQMMGAGNSTFNVPANWRPGEREGNVSQYNIAINMISMMPRSPAQQSSTVTQLLTQIYIPLQQQMMAQGIQIDFSALTEMFADLLYLPELRRIIRVGGNQLAKPGPMTDVGKSPVTQRNYTRRSIPGTQNGMMGVEQAIFQQSSDPNSSPNSQTNGVVE